MQAEKVNFYSVDYPTITERIKKVDFFLKKSLVV